MNALNLLRKLIVPALAAVIGMAGGAYAGQKHTVTVNNYHANQSLQITGWDDGVRRWKYSIWSPEDRRTYWYASNGSANRGIMEAPYATTANQWCRVRRLYGDDIQIPECWGGFYYTSDLITGLDGLHYEIWVSPDSLSYWKFRAQETNTWYAHDGSANDGRKRTSKEDWCRIIIYHGAGIIRVPKTCEDILERILNTGAGVASYEVAHGEMAALSEMIGTANTINDVRQLFGKGGGDAFTGIVVGLAVEEFKDALDLRGKNAAGVAAETVGTAAATTVITGLLTAASASTMGAGFALAVAVGGTTALLDASDDTTIKFYDGGLDRYHTDLNGLTASVGAPELLKGTFEWKECASEGGQCSFTSARQVRYGANGQYFYKAAAGKIHCNNDAFGGDPAPGVVKHCSVPLYNGEKPVWVDCAGEGGHCAFPGTRKVMYGANGTWAERSGTNGIGCNNQVFGDPLPGVVKRCYMLVQR